VGLSDLFERLGASSLVASSNLATKPKVSLNATLFVSNGRSLQGFAMDVNFDSD